MQAMLIFLFFKKKFKKSHKFSTHYKVWLKKKRSHRLQLESKKKSPFAPHGKVNTFQQNPKLKDHQKLSLQLFPLNKSTQFSYQHHFITVINKKSTRISTDYIEKHTCIVNHHFSLFVCLSLLVTEFNSKQNYSTSYHHILLISYLNCKRSLSD